MYGTALTTDPTTAEALRRVQVRKAQLAAETEIAYFERDRQLRESVAWETTSDDGNWIPNVAPIPKRRGNWIPAAVQDDMWDAVIAGYSLNAA